VAVTAGVALCVVAVSMDASWSFWGDCARTVLLTWQPVAVAAVLLVAGLSLSERRGIQLASLVVCVIMLVTQHAKVLIGYSGYEIATIDCYVALWALAEIAVVAGAASCIEVVRADDAVAYVLAGCWMAVIGGAGLAMAPMRSVVLCNMALIAMASIATVRGLMLWFTSRRSVVGKAGGGPASAKPCIGELRGVRRMIASGVTIGAALAVVGFMIAMRTMTPAAALANQLRARDWMRLRPIQTAVRMGDISLWGRLCEPNGCEMIVGFHDGSKRLLTTDELRLMALDVVARSSCVCESGGHGGSSSRPVFPVPVPVPVPPRN
jgi:hypothetical protein